MRSSFLPLTLQRTFVTHKISNNNISIRYVNSLEVGTSLTSRFAGNNNSLLQIHRAIALLSHCAYSRTYVLTDIHPCRGFVCSCRTTSRIKWLLVWTCSWILDCALQCNISCLHQFLYWEAFIKRMGTEDC
jgi:hypothetical protein